MQLTQQVSHTCGLEQLCASLRGCLQNTGPIPKRLLFLMVYHSYKGQPKWLLSHGQLFHYRKPKFSQPSHLHPNQSESLSSQFRASSGFEGSLKCSGVTPGIEFQETPCISHLLPNLRPTWTQPPIWGRGLHEIANRFCRKG
jgi:hypothetical protein